MKYVYLILAIASASIAQAVQITGFGTGDFTQLLPFGADSQNSTSYTISGTDSGSLYGSLNTPISSFGSVANLYLTGTLTFATNPAVNFQIGVYDSDGDGRLYLANWSDFATSGVEQEIILSFSGLDNSGTGGFSNTVSTVALIGGGSGTFAINFNLNNLATTSAVPEPSTYGALFGIVALGFCALRRRRKV
jgi:hypothetical protein